MYGKENEQEDRIEEESLKKSGRRGGQGSGVWEGRVPLFSFPRASIGNPTASGLSHLLLDSLSQRESKDGIESDERVREWEGREGGKRSARARRRKNLRRRLEEMEGRKVLEGRECESIQEELDERFFKKNGRWEGSTVWEGWRGRGVGARR